VNDTVSMKVSSGDRGGLFDFSNIILVKRKKYLIQRTTRKLVILNPYQLFIRYYYLYLYLYFGFWATLTMSGFWSDFNVLLVTRVVNISKIKTFF